MSSEKARLSAIKQKRILKEIKDIQQTPIDPDNNVFEASPGCYVLINDEDITSHKIMIIGPEDTPYENGFYMFDFKYHRNHPFEAPSVQFLTTDGNVRFNPNLYSNGKVCLSILGTWSGPAWEPTMSLRVVCEYLRSILNEKPIQNEPGFEKSEGKEMKMYNNYVTTENYQLAIWKHFYNLPGSLRPFYKTIYLKFIENFGKIFNKLNKLDDIDKYLGVTVGPYHKSIRSTILGSRLNMMLGFLSIYKNYKEGNFKDTPLFSLELIEKEYQNFKPMFLTEVVKVCIEEIDNVENLEYTSAQIITSIHETLNKNKNKVDNFTQLKKFIVKKYNKYNPNIKMSDCFKSLENKELIFDFILDLILMNIDNKTLSKKISIYISSNTTQTRELCEVLNVNDLYD